MEYQVRSSLLLCDLTVRVCDQGEDRYNKQKKEYSISFYPPTDDLVFKVNGIDYKFSYLQLKECQFPDNVMIHRDYFRVRRADTDGDMTEKARSTLTEHCKTLWDFVKQQYPNVFHEANKQRLRYAIDQHNNDIERKRADIKEIILKREKLEAELDKLA